MENPKNDLQEWQQRVDHLPGLTPVLKQRYLQIIQKTEKYVPSSVTELRFEDIGEIETIIQQLRGEIHSGLGFYSFFIKFLRKVQSLIVEQYPDQIHTLNRALLEDITYAKIDFPTEEEVDQEIYAFLDGRRPTDYSFSPFTLDQKISDLTGDNDVSRRIKKVYDQYQDHFRKYRKSA